MNKTSRNYFILAIILFIVSFFYCKDGGTQNRYKRQHYPVLYSDTIYTITNPKIDTTKQKVQYFLKLPYTQDQFRKKIDTIYQVTMQIGKSMTVDQSEQLKGFVLSVIGRLSNDAKIDSTKK